MANQIEVEIELQTRKTVQSLGRLENQFEKFGKDTAKNLAKVPNVFNTIKGVVGGAAIIGAFRSLTRVAQNLFNVFVTQGIEAAKVQGDAINDLNRALAASGILTTQTSKGFQEFASSLQGASTFGDEVILQNAAILQSLGQLSEKGLREATQASLDMAAALGISLNAAVLLVGKAAAGEVGSFSRYGLTVKKAATDSETFENALRAINNQFGGAAAAQIKTFSGATSQLSNTFGDLTEKFGDLVTTNPAVLGSVKTLNALFKEAQISVTGNKEGIQTFVNETLVSLVRGFGETIKALDNVSTGFSVLFSGVSIGVEKFALAVIRPLKLIEDGFNSVVSRVPILKDKFGEGSESIQNIFDTLVESVQEDIGDINSALEQKSALASLGDKIIESSEQIKIAIDLETASIEKNESAFKNASVSKASAKQGELDALREFQREQIAFEQEQAELRRQLETEKADAELQNLANVLGREEAVREQARINRLKPQGKLVEAEKKQIAAREKAEKESIFKVEKFDDQSQKQKIANVKSTLGSISTLQQSSNKTAFAIGKSANIAQATMDGITAVQVALKSAPVPFNFVLAGLVGAATAANVAKIAATKPPQFQDGGVVGGFVGASAGPDNVSILARRGEMFLNAAQQQELFNTISGGTEQGLAREVSALTAAINSQPVIVEIDGREVARATRNAKSDGFLIGA